MNAKDLAVTSQSALACARDVLASECDATGLSHASGQPNSKFLVYRIYIARHRRRQLCYTSAMKIRNLRISNFRGIRSGEVNFTDHTVLIGPNNAGKTTIVEALALLLGRDRMVRDMTEHDFYGGDPKPADRIRIVATLDGFAENSVERNGSWFGLGRATPKWRDPSTRTLYSDVADGRVLCLQIAADCRFDRHSLEVDVVRYFYDDDDTRDPFDDESVTRLPGNAVREIGFFLDPANRTWDKTISFASDLFRQVVQYAADKPSTAVLAERDRLRHPDKPLDTDPGLAELVANIDGELAHYFTRPTSLKLRLTTTDSAGVLAAVYPHYLGDHGFVVPSRREGTGLVSLQKLALLMQFGHIRIDRGDNFIMALEEPELHIPPPLQRRLLHSMEALTSQAIVTTHSPAIASSCKPTDLMLVRQQNGILTTSPLLDQPLDKNATNPLRVLLLSDRHALVDALMHERVLVPEGKEDYLWLSRLSRLVETNGKAGHGGLDFAVKVGVVPTPSSAVVQTFSFLGSRHPNVSCLVDGDAAGVGYIRSLTALPEPPTQILRLNDGCEIEDVVTWIVSAEAAVLQDASLTEHGIPSDIEALRAGLKIKSGAGRLKGDHQAHDALCDALAMSDACIARAAGLLAEFAHVLSDRPGPSNVLLRDTALSTDTTTVWIVTI